MAKRMTIAARDRIVLDALACLPIGWVRPMDIGGTDSSHHSATLARLVRRGLVERRERGSARSLEYRLTPTPEARDGKA